MNKDDKLNLYHLVYRVQPQDIYSKGYNIEKSNEVEALITWRILYPDAVFISLIKLDV